VNVAAADLPSDLVWDGPADAPRTIVLAHGAGAGMHAPFLAAFAAGLADFGLRVGRFNFPYMARSQRSGTPRPPDREPVLRAAWLQVVTTLGRRGLIIGGKSLGGRIASLIAAEAGVAGLVCLGYPFHPVGQPDRLRVAPLQSLTTPTLIVQGTRDPFGTRDEVAGYALPPVVRLHWLADGNHDFAPRRASGHTQQQHWAAAISAVAAFCEAL